MRPIRALNASTTSSPEQDGLCQEVINPVDGSRTDYSKTGGYRARQKYLFDLGQMPFVALRRGELKARGWEFRATYCRAIFAGKPPPKLTAADVFPNFQQKGVDMRIGIDVATLLLKRIVERIVLFSGDTDMIPALKLARREGIQVFVVKLEPWDLKHELVEDSDGVRSLKPMPRPATAIPPHSIA